MNTFFITGLPRSRTAWIANLLTYGPAFCFHEAPLFCGNDARKMKDLFEKTGKEFVGDCDSAIPFFMDEIERSFPQSRHTLIVRKDMSAVIHGCNRIFGFDTEPMIKKGVAKLVEYVDRFNPLIVPFDKLDEEAYCRSIWEHCIPGASFDSLRFSMLKDMNIQLTEKGLDKRRSLCLG